MEPGKVRPARSTAARRTARRMLPLSLVLLLSALIVACGGATGGADGDTEEVTVGTPEGEDSRTVDGLEVETLLTGLDTPWEVAFAPDGRVFITERPGTIRVLEDGELRREPYAELQTQESGEGGQLGLALDPDFEENGHLYAYHTSGTDGSIVNRLVRLVDEGNEAREDGELLEAPAASIHNGGRVAVGPDGKLYATLGTSPRRGSHRIGKLWPARSYASTWMGPSRKITRSTARRSTPTATATRRGSRGMRAATSTPPSTGPRATTS